MTPDPELRRRLLLPARQLRAVLASLGTDHAALPAELLDDEADPAATPTASDVFAPDGAPHPSIAAGVALVVGGPVPRILVRAGTPARRRLTVLAVTGELGASLARDLDAPEPARPVEQSLFGAHLLGAELQRCLPPVPVSEDARWPVRGADAALLLTALRTPDAPAGRRLAAHPAVAALSDGFDASLEVTVSLPPDGDRRGVVDRLLWVVADGGWWELRPGSDALGAPAVDVLPVRRGDLPAAVAPLVAGPLAVLAAAGTPA